MGGVPVKKWPLYHLDSLGDFSESPFPPFLKKHRQYLEVQDTGCNWLFASL